MFWRLVWLDSFILVTLKGLASLMDQSLVSLVSTWYDSWDVRPSWLPASSSPALPIALCGNCQRLLIQETSSEAGVSIFPKCKLLNKIFCAQKKKKGGFTSMLGASFSLSILAHLLVYWPQSCPLPTVALLQLVFYSILFGPPLFPHTTALCPIQGPSISDPSLSTVRCSTQPPCPSSIPCVSILPEYYLHTSILPSFYIRSINSTQTKTL